jgi:hypothetical protein
VNRLVAALGLVASVALVGCVEPNTEPPSTTAPVTSSCWSIVGQLAGRTEWTFAGPASPPPALQVSKPSDCRYRIESDGAGGQRAILDATGCFTEDPADDPLGSGTLIYREDLCGPRAD